MENTVLVIALFAGVVIVVAVAFRRRLSAHIKGPGGTGLQIDASNPEPRPGVRLEDATSRHGGAKVRDNTGRGAEVRKLDVDKDIDVSSAPPERPHPN